mmetsp:Transcript_38834/g.101566  ORF Transcript_38834/g.101566 Transcript_38834/m.101566 type:complete len:220 (+) Transcript_38834:733-1392(+)
MNCNFSLMCVIICTVITVFFLSLCNSSFRSSIFSFRFWFSIFNCSKSITCRFSANSSFFRSACSSLARRFFNEMLEPRTSSTSWSLSSSKSSISWITFFGDLLVRATVLSLQSDLALESSKGVPTLNSFGSLFLQCVLELVGHVGGLHLLFPELHPHRMHLLQDIAVLVLGDAPFPCAILRLVAEATAGGVELVFLRLPCQVRRLQGSVPLFQTDSCVL